MNRLLREAVVLFTMFQGFLFVSCENSALPLTDSDDGMIRIAIVLDSTASRTVNYDQTDAALYVLSGSREGTAEETLGSWTADTSTMALSLAPGAWSFRLEAYDEETSGYLIGEDTRDVTLTESGDLSFSLEAIQRGTGTLSVTLNWPDGSDVSSVSATLGGEDISSDLLTGMGYVSYLNSRAAAGNSLLVFRLYNDDSLLLATVTELVRIRMNLQSSKTFDLTEDDLNGKPDQPSEVTSARTSSTDSTSKGKVTISWSDESHDETGFLVYRNDEIEPITTLGFNTTSYTDADAERGEAYTYRVCSFNSFGSSDAVEAEALTVPYLVKFQNNYGNSSAAYTITYEEVLPGGVFTRSDPVADRTSGLTFAGWIYYTVVNGRRTEITYTRSSPVNFSLTLTADWTSE